MLRALFYSQFNWWFSWFTCLGSSRLNSASFGSARLGTVFCLAGWEEGHSRRPNRTDQSRTGGVR